MRAVDLFAGCGGLSLGLVKAGVDVVAAYENWEAALAIYRSNFKHPAFGFDLNDVETAAAHIATLKPDLIAGGPPCQDFSSAGKRIETGARGELTIAFAQIVATVGPEWFIMENVDRIQKAKIFADAKQVFKAAGYGLTEVVLDASRCGVPQVRKRMFLMGKRGAPDGFMQTHLDAKLAAQSLTVKAYFGKTIGTNYYYRHPRSYARRAIFSIDEPSPTIRGVNRPIPPTYKPHPGDATSDLSKVRSLTSAERAAIQTFPTTFKWQGSKSVLEQVIGNAVPVNLARFVGKAILSCQQEFSGSRKRKVSAKAMV